ncbi:mitochondrial intermediate peptidase [Onthophagus taurus]|uniref:mitochondrial intermediate peptidase n=1 Tax=Onthophagus taurus TaxID=166361 RepID=UPI0039BDB9DD
MKELLSLIRRTHVPYNRRFLKTWSPLTTTFNTRPVQNTKGAKTGGLFNIPELSTSNGFYELQDQCARRTDELMCEAVGSSRNRKIVEIFDELSNTLCKVADLAEFIRLAHPDGAYSIAAESACCAVSGVVEKLNTNRNLYNALRGVSLNGDIIKTDPIDQHVADLFLFDFEQSGIHLDDNSRHKAVKLNDIILQLGQQFVAGTGQPRYIKKNLTPKFIRSVFTNEGDYVIVSGLHGDSANPVIREFAYRIFLQPEMHQETILKELFMSRFELADICGFETYANKALNGGMIDSPQLVMEFLNNLSENIREKAGKDFEYISKLKKSEYPNSGPLAPWDIPYYTQKVKKEHFKLNTIEYSPYFSLGACMDGLNHLFTSLYGITLEEVKINPGETWIEDVYKLGVIHEDEGLLGYIYCDFYERSGKPNQDCHFTIRGGKTLSDGTYQLPIVVLMLNLPTPKWGNPCLLTPGMVDNLFHEMGHAMHSMLGRTKYQHTTGTRCSTDLAEVPSVLMEYFAADPRVIKTFAKHYQTKQPIPEPMLEKLCESKHIFNASEMQLQIFYSALDQRYHDKPFNSSTTQILEEVQNEYYGLPYVKNTAWQLRFSHLVGYGAKYYSYLVSRALASWIWQSYFKNDPFSREQGERYRRECLAHGGGKPPWNLVADFLKLEPTPALLAKSLINDIEVKQL